MFQEQARKNEIEVIKAVMRLKRLNGLDRIESLGNKLYSHTNTRNRIRYIQICKSQEHAKETSEKTNGEYFKSWSQWICLYEK